MTWPIADFDDLRRLRVLAAATPYARLGETVLATPFDEFWTSLADVEVSFPGLLPDVRRVRVRARDGERLELRVRAFSGLRGRFEVTMRPGWCVMRSRTLMFAMAAAPSAAGTRFAYTTALRLRGRQVYGPLLGPLQARLVRRTLSRFEARFGRA
jgi:hypothetical protein